MALRLSEGLGRTADSLSNKGDCEYEYEEGKKSQQCQQKRFGPPTPDIVFPTASGDITLLRFANRVVPTYDQRKSGKPEKGIGAFGVR